MVLDLPTSEITGQQLIEQAGLEVSEQTFGFGPAFCSVDNVGCDYPSVSCFCSSIEFWNYFNLVSGEWQFASVGANQRILLDGDADAWMWAAFGASPPPFTIEGLKNSQTLRTRYYLRDLKNRDSWDDVWQGFSNTVFPSPGGEKLDTSRGDDASTVVLQNAPPLTTYTRPVNGFLYPGDASVEFWISRAVAGSAVQVDLYVTELDGSGATLIASANTTPQTPGGFNKETALLTIPQLTALDHDRLRLTISTTVTSGDSILLGFNGPDGSGFDSLLDLPGSAAADRTWTMY
ncbi:MAG: hypothetical protein V2A74_08530 [bacterium]